MPQVPGTVGRASTYRPDQVFPPSDRGAGLPSPDTGQIVHPDSQARYGSSHSLWPGAAFHSFSREHQAREVQEYTDNPETPVDPARVKEKREDDK